MAAEQFGGPGECCRGASLYQLLLLQLLCRKRRLEVEGKAVAALRAAVGPHAAALGLELMGAVVGRDWSDAEAALMEEGMRLVGRDFRSALLYVHAFRSM